VPIIIILQSSSFGEGFLLLFLAHIVTIDWQQSNQVTNKTNKTVLRITPPVMDSVSLILTSFEKVVL
jgi:hypothetical protein